MKAALRNYLPAILLFAAVLLLWAALKATRYGPFLYAVGGQPLSAYVSGVPVALERLSSYVISGTMAAAGAVVPHPSLRPRPPLGKASCRRPSGRV